MLNRRSFLKLSACLAGALVLPAVFDEATRPVLAASGQLNAIDHIRTDRSEFFLTIDDGWFPDALLQIIESLKQAEVRATFFLVGSAILNAEKHLPGVTRRLLKDGNQLGYHTMFHQRSKRLSLNSVAWFLNDYKSWQDAVHLAVKDRFLEKNVKNYARAPGGYFSTNFMQLCAARELVPIGWNRTADTIGEGQPLIQSGDILLMHATPQDALILQQSLDHLETLVENGVQPALFAHALSHDSIRTSPELEIFIR
jgi:peptidoglycan/xylan/chitin deacetylase (PgdA/CDA1 family)